MIIFKQFCSIAIYLSGLGVISIRISLLPHKVFLIPIITAEQSFIMLSKVMYGRTARMYGREALFSR